MSSNHARQTSLLNNHVQVGTSRSAIQTSSSSSSNLQSITTSASTSPTSNPPPLRTAAQIRAEREKQKNPSTNNKILVGSSSSNDKGKGKQTERERDGDGDGKPTNTVTLNSNSNKSNNNNINNSNLSSTSNHPALTDTRSTISSTTYTHRKKNSSQSSHFPSQSSTSSNNSNLPSRTSSPFILNNNLPIPIPSHSAWSAGSVSGANGPASSSSYATVNASNSNGTNTPTFAMEEDSDASLPFGMRSITGSGSKATSTFQPAGLVRNRFEEFDRIRKIEINGTGTRNGDGGKDLESLKRARKREEREREEGRLGRRLEKLLSLHYDPSTSPLAPQDPSTTPLISSTISSLTRSSKFLTLTSSSLGISSTATRSKELRNLEKQIVPWEKDSEVKACPICSTNFTLAIRKHHCRLCGRVVCASEPLNIGNFNKEEDLQSKSSNSNPSLATTHDEVKKRRKCSNLMVLSDPPNLLFLSKGSDTEKFNPAISSKVRDIRTSLTSLQKEELAFLEKRRKKIMDDQERELDLGFQKRKEEEWELERENERIVGIRCCRDCREVLLRKQFRIGNDKMPRYLQRYQDLIQLQKEIEQSLPEFQEMVLGLQKQDQTTALGSSSKASLSLQRDAAQARKQLLINFANYDRIAKEIKNLPDEVGEDDDLDLDLKGVANQNGEGGKDGAQKKVKLAIFMRANLFLQQNMFPLQRLPKPGEKASSSTSSETSSLNGDNNNPLISSALTSTPTSSSGPTRSLRSLIAGSGSIPTPSTQNQNQHPHLTPSGIDPTLSIDEVQNHLSILMEQREKVESFANAAEKLRKFEDAGMLRRSAGELRVEEERFRKRLRELGKVGT